MFVAEFCYWLIRGSIIIAGFSAVGEVVSLYAGRLICEYIWYMLSQRHLVFAAVY